MAKINTKIIKVETSVARPVDLQIFRGENVPIELHFVNYRQVIDLTGYSVEAYYQSPDMGDSWYKDQAAGHLVVDESGEFVTWFWTPDIDAGADKYKWFVRVYKSDDEDDSYRAFGTIEMLASPAHNQIQPLPVPPIPIDCSKYEWLNYPWLDDSAGSVRGYNLADGTVTPDKLSAKYLRDTGTDQYSHQVDYLIQSKFNGSSYFDVNPVWHIPPIDGVAHTVEVAGINGFDWYGYARYRDTESDTWQGYVNGCQVTLIIDGEDEDERDIGDLMATISRVSDTLGDIVLDVFDGQSFATSQFAISLRLEVNTVDACLVTHRVTCTLKSLDPSVLGFVCNHGEDVDAAIATDETYWGGFLAPDSYVDRKIAEAIADIPAPDYPVTSVNGKTGAVTLAAADVGAATVGFVVSATSGKADKTDVLPATYDTQSETWTITPHSITVSADSVEFSRPNAELILRDSQVINEMEVVDQIEFELGNYLPLSGGTLQGGATIATNCIVGGGGPKFGLDTYTGAVYMDASATPQGWLLAGTKVADFYSRQLLDAGGTDWTVVARGGTAYNLASGCAQAASALTLVGSIQQTLSGKQDTLTFDAQPSANSTNPVYSGGVYSYIQNTLGDINAQLETI